MMEKRNYRITYQCDDGCRQYYVSAENSEFAVFDFTLRTSRPRECVIRVEVQVGYQWVKTL